MTEDRCLHDMLILNGKMTCSLCLGLDDSIEMAIAGTQTADVVTMQNLVGLRLAYGLTDLAAA